MEIHGELFNMGILLVEDEHFFRLLLIQALNSLGFSSILEAENGKNALRLLERHDVDIIITDIEMRHLNGFDLVRAVRMGETRLPRNTPVIFLTGLSDVTTLSSASQLDVQGFLVKPVSARQLLDKIREVIEKDIQVRSVQAYSTMVLSSTVDAGETGPGSRTPGSSATAPMRPTPAEAAPGHAPGAQGAAKCLDVLMLAEGMRLRQDVYARGSLLLREGTLLEAPLIAVLQDMRGLLDNRRIEVEVPPG